LNKCLCPIAQEDKLNEKPFTLLNSIKGSYEQALLIDYGTWKIVISVDSQILSRTAKTHYLTVNLKNKFNKSHSSY